jgi:hypothetical protein
VELPYLPTSKRVAASVAHVSGPMRSSAGANDPGFDRRAPVGRPTVNSLADSPVDHPGDRVGELVVEVAGLWERISDKDEVIADLRHRLDVADRRLDEATEDRRRVDELRVALADAVAAERIAASEAAALRTELDALRKRRRRWFRWK